MKLGSRFGEQHQGPLQGLGALLFLWVRQSVFVFSSTAVGPMANAGGVPRFLRWGHGGPLGESWVASLPRGPEPSLQRLWCSGTRLLAGWGLGRNGPQRQVRIIAVT